VHVDEMLKYSAVGTPGEIRAYLDEFAGRTKADELITVHQTPDVTERLRSVTLLAESLGQAAG
jgi:alkanesulfonate monooxygenase SsuD/methylene tetrahydromethanopterin reductase-like flavin-dependent oxidoreductase (luciferase family)